MTALSIIFTEIDARLSGIVAPEGSYERMPSGDPDVFPALEVHDGGDTPAEFEAGATRSELSFEVVGFVEGHGGAQTHDAMTVLHAKVVFALCGDGENLGGIVENIEARDRRPVVAELAAKRRIGFSQDFIVTLITPRGDPRALA